MKKPRNGYMVVATKSGSKKLVSVPPTDMPLTKAQREEVEKRHEAKQARIEMDEAARRLYWSGVLDTESIIKELNNQGVITQFFSDNMDLLRNRTDYMKIGYSKDQEYVGRLKRVIAKYPNLGLNELIKNIKKEIGFNPKMLDSEGNLGENGKTFIKNIRRSVNDKTQTRVDDGEER